MSLSKIFVLIINIVCIFLVSLGLQIKTPDGSMATAQQLRAAASEAPSGLPPYYNPAAVHSNKALDQVHSTSIISNHKPRDKRILLFLLTGLMVIPFQFPLTKF